MQGKGGDLDFDIENSSANILSDPLSISDLIGNGAKFEINPNFDDEEFVSELFDELNPGSDDEDNSHVESAKLVSPWQYSFDELRLQMVKLNDLVYKKIINVGDAEKGYVPKNARVCIRYNAYWEGEGAPFDSSILRGSTYSFYTGRGEVLRGLEDAVCSMYKGEEAQFLISYHLLFHEMGCPPRVKPKADGLFIIECVGFNPVGDLHATDGLDQNGRTDFTFVLAKVKEVHLKGIDFFNQEMYKNASKAFIKAVSALNYCSLKNEEEQLQQTAFLIKLHTNLAVCYNKLKQPAKTMLMCREIHRLTKKPSCKALFQEGRALLMLGEYKRARQLLIRAQAIEPNNSDVNNELKILESRFEKYKDYEKNLWSKAMEMKKLPQQDARAKDDISATFRAEISNILKMLNDDENVKTFTLPPGLTQEEIDVVQDMVKDMNMKLQLSPLDNCTYSLIKK